MTKRKDFVYVAIQFFLLACYFLVFNQRAGGTPLWMQIISGVLVVAGTVLVILPILQLNKFISVFPTPVSGAQLVTNGAFKYIRHPIYAGIILGGAGLAIMMNNLLQLLVIIILFVLFEVKSDYEEQQLAKVFGDYEDYKKHTYKFFPGMR
jgi:protein-S-isoprenylcysteine O-methyltransferase Ste14